MIASFAKIRFKFYLDSLATGQSSKELSRQLSRKRKIGKARYLLIPKRDAQSQSKRGTNRTEIARKLVRVQLSILYGDTSKENEE